jgi:hypothetical protein
MTRVRVAAGIAELLAGATHRESIRTGDAKSGSRMERVVIDAVPHVVKHLDVEDSWLMRATGDLGSRQLQIFTSTLLDALPGCIDHTVVAVAPVVVSRGRQGTALLMRDVSRGLVPEGSDPIEADQELRFLDHMAALHAAYWGFAGDDRLISLATHYLFLSEATAAAEAARGSTDGVPPLIAAGWKRLSALSPPAVAVVGRLLDDPSPLVAALEATPQTLVHGDWKLGNLGSDADGRTILLDWDRVSRGPATLDLGWYLAVNADRLAHGREALIAGYRNRLAAHGVETDLWFERQMTLTLLGAFLQLGWEKLGRGGVELDWWHRRILAAAPLLDG